MWKVLAAIMVLATVAVGLTAIIIQSPAPEDDKIIRINPQKL